MATKKELERTELEKQCEEARKNFERLSALLEEQRKKEAEEKKVKLAVEKDARFQEVIDAYKHADKLRDAVVEDYGYFTYETEGNIPSLWDLVFKR